MPRKGGTVLGVLQVLNLSHACGIHQPAEFASQYSALDLRLAQCTQSTEVRSVVLNKTSPVVVTVLEVPRKEAPFKAGFICPAALKLSAQLNLVHILIKLVASAVVAANLPEVFHLGVGLVA